MLEKKQYFINLAKKIYNLMIPLKLYNARQIVKLCQYHNLNASYNSIHTALRIGVNERLINCDKEYTHVITYWKSTI
jgi:hypothetical protein